MSKKQSWVRVGAGIALALVLTVTNCNRAVWFLVWVAAGGCSAKDSVSPPPDPTPAACHEGPDWSPRGFIAYRDHGFRRKVGGGSTLVDTTLAGIWVIDPATGDKARLLRIGSYPDWSPTGELVVFTEAGRIHTALANGTELQQVTRDSDDHFPAWHPSGERIVYDSRHQTEGYYVWEMDQDGFNQKRVSATPGRFPAWRPDGSGIVYKRAVQEAGSEVYRDLFVMDSSGVDQARLTRSKEEERNPEFSPDGNLIAFARSGCLWVMDSDGSNPRQLTFDRGMHPSWSPDGTEIVYEGVGGVLWIVSLQSLEKRQLTEPWPAWSP